MRLLNEALCDAVLTRIDVAESGLLAGLIIKSTFDLDPLVRKLALSSEPMPLVRQVLDTPFGVLHGECFLKKKGIDLCLLGTVRRPAAVQQATVRLSLGERTWELRVYGDRRWQRKPGASTELTLVPSPPEPFTELALGYERAFGGERLFGGMPFPCPDNPRGRGYYGTPEEALDQLLPNIEDGASPEQREFSAEQPPKVAGFGPYPSFWALRSRDSVTLDAEQKRVTSVSPSLFNHAHPALVLDALPRGASIVVEGLASETLVCPVPSPPTEVEVAIGARCFALPAPIDGLFLWADSQKLVVTQRARFKYERRPEELRTVTVRNAPPRIDGVPA